MNKLKVNKINYKILRIKINNYLIRFNIWIIHLDNKLNKLKIYKIVKAKCWDNKNNIDLNYNNIKWTHLGRVNLIVIFKDNYNKNSMSKKNKIRYNNKNKYRLKNKYNNNKD